MESKTDPAEGQLCECAEHPVDALPSSLGRVYRYKGRKPCYEWWCEECYEATEPLEDEYPVGDAIHCPMIPGLD